MSTTFVGSNVLDNAVPLSKKSLVPLASKSSIASKSLYVSLLTRPSDVYVYGETPTIPSLSPSTYPASSTSLHWSPSESRSNLLGIPSPSVSKVCPPSNTSVIPSLSSSLSSASGTPSESESRNIICASLVTRSWSHLNAGVLMSSL